jgi:dolichol-phosphate mannosyltransferase
MKHALNKNERHARRSIFIVLPAFNEGPTLSTLLSRIDESMSEAGLQYRVVLVDDGSMDDTLAIAERFSKKMPLVIKRHDSNQGLGATIRDGLVMAANLAIDNDIIITMDADDTHSPGLILRMVEMIREGFDVVIASRFQKSARVIGVPLHRRLLSRCASMLFRCVLPIEGVKDFTCGYRAYRAGAIKKALGQYGSAFFTRDGFECMVDILLKLRNMGLIFGEVPIILRYDHKDGHTKMNLFSTIKSSLFLLVKRRLGR